MKCGLCHLVVSNDGTSFKGAFVAIFKALNLNYDIFAMYNPKGLSVEYLYLFLNKATIIAMEDRQSNDVFVPVGIAADMHIIVSPLVKLIFYAVLSLLAMNTDSQLISTYLFYLNLH